MPDVPAGERRGRLSVCGRAEAMLVEGIDGGGEGEIPVLHQFVENFPKEIQGVLALRVQRESAQGSPGSHALHGRPWMAPLG